jgi:predicted nucleic acid-binding protein
LLVETDIILAHVKERDWLKPYAEAPLKAAEKGEVELYASCEALHELYYVAVKLGLSLEQLLEKLVALAGIRNLRWVPVTERVVLAALTLMVEYGLTSNFDACYAATAQLADPDRVVVSTDSVYDRVPGLKRVDPRNLALSL